MTALRMHPAECREKDQTGDRIIATLARKAMTNRVKVTIVVCGQRSKNGPRMTQTPAQMKSDQDYSIAFIWFHPR